jgi:chromosome segregation ATPase
VAGEEERHGLAEAVAGLRSGQAEEDRRVEGLRENLERKEKDIRRLKVALKEAAGLGPELDLMRSLIQEMETECRLLREGTAHSAEEEARALGQAEGTVQSLTDQLLVAAQAIVELRESNVELQESADSLHVVSERRAGELLELAERLAAREEEVEELTARLEGESEAEPLVVVKEVVKRAPALDIDRYLDTYESRKKAFIPGRSTRGGSTSSGGGYSESAGRDYDRVGAEF